MADALASVYLSAGDGHSDEDQTEESNSSGKEAKDGVHGHVNSISVLRSYRRLGLAKKLMLRSREFFLHRCRNIALFCSL